MTRLILTLSLIISLVACGGNKNTQASNDTTAAVIPSFNADSAYAYCAAQCDFGYRTMNSEAHDKCGRWIADKFRSYGLTVIEQKANLKGYDGTVYRATNIIASLNPEHTNRILLCAHWDTRPWADNDPNEANHRTPVMGANDGASGIAVLIELARIITNVDSLNGNAAKLNVGIDFVCFDAEDSGIPQWETAADPGDTWALGSQYWAANPHRPNYRATYGILLDMVGGRGARFYKEGYSMHYAPSIVSKVWTAAASAGFGSRFPNMQGGFITDDHVPVNSVAHIPTIDIVPHHPDCPQSNFGPTWHTVDDNMTNIDKETLRAVGQTIVHLLYN